MVRNLFVLCSILVLAAALMACQAPGGLEAIKSDLTMALEVEAAVEDGEIMLNPCFSKVLEAGMLLPLHI